MPVRHSGHARLGRAIAVHHRKERYETDILLDAEPDQFVVLAACRDAVLVLDADDGSDRLRLGQVFRADVRDAEFADQALLSQFGQRAEAVGERTGPAFQAHADPEVDHVEVVAAELAQVFLDLPAQLLRACRIRKPVSGGVPSGADLCGDDQVVHIGRQRGVDQLVRRAWAVKVERGGVDVVHAEFDGSAQHGDRIRTVANASVRSGHKPHRAEAEPVDGHRTELPGARRGGGRSRFRHGSSLPAGMFAAGELASCCQARRLESWS